MGTNHKLLSLVGGLSVVLLGTACASDGSDAAPSEAARSQAAPSIAVVGAQSPDKGLKAVKAATARYHSIEQAKADGYTGVDEPCVASPEGAMGIHYVNPALLQDPALDPLRPEILLYVPSANGKLKLVGVEYWKADADQKLDTREDEPTLLDQPFGAPMEGHAPGMPVHYDLHVWLFKDNPAGMFAPFNPTLTCPPAAS